MSGYLWYAFLTCLIKSFILPSWFIMQVRSSDILGVKSEKSKYMYILKINRISVMRPSFIHQRKMMKNRGTKEQHIREYNKRITAHQRTKKRTIKFTEEQTFFLYRYMQPSHCT